MLKLVENPFVMFVAQWFPQSRPGPRSRQREKGFRANGTMLWTLYILQETNLIERAQS